MRSTKSIIIYSSIITLLSACQSKSNLPESPSKINDSTITISIQQGVQPSMQEEGMNTDYYSNGKEKMKGVIKNAKREGLWQAWYENGNLWSEAEYKNGINHGKSATYFENGKVRYEGKFENGNKIGDWKYYDENGNLIKTITN